MGESGEKGKDEGGEDIEKPQTRYVPVMRCNVPRFLCVNMCWGVWGRLKRRYQHHLLVYNSPRVHNVIGT